MGKNLKEEREPRVYMGAKHSRKRGQAIARWEHVWCVGETAGGPFGWSGVREGRKNRKWVQGGNKTKWHRAL